MLFLSERESNRTYKEISYCLAVGDYLWLVVSYFLCSKDRLNIFNLIFLFLEYLILMYFKHKIVITIKLIAFVWYRISYITPRRIGYYMQPIENGVKTRFYKRIPYNNYKETGNAGENVYMSILCLIQYI